MCAGREREPAEARQIGDDILRECGREAGERPVLREVPEGEDNDERFVRARRGLPAQDPPGVEGLQGWSSACLGRGAGELLELGAWTDLMILCKSDPKMIIPFQRERS